MPKSLLLPIFLQYKIYLDRCAEAPHLASRSALYLTLSIEKRTASPKNCGRLDVRMCQASVLLQIGLLPDDGSLPVVGAAQADKHLDVTALPSNQLINAAANK